MKFFHLSDLHIGLKLLQMDLKEDQRYILKEIIQLAKKHRPDAVVIAGDVYDKSIPSAEAVQIFDEFVTSLCAEVPETVIMMISGNHDNAYRLDCFRHILSNQKVYMIGVPPQNSKEYIQRVSLRDVYGKVNFYLLPFVRPSMVREVLEVEDDTSYSYEETIHRLIKRENINLQERNVLVSHQFYLPKGAEKESVERMDSEMVTVGNIDAVCADILSLFDYAALGHIHKSMQVGNPYVRYCGTPLSCSVSEAGQEKSIIMVEMKEKEKHPEVTLLPLHPMRQVRVIEDTYQNLITQNSDDYVSLILTDEKEINALDMQDKLRYAFPNLLEIQRKYTYGIDYSKEVQKKSYKEPYQLICEFLPDLTEDEKSLIEEVINEAKEALL